MSFGYENGNEMGDDTPAYMYWRLVLIGISIPSGDWVLAEFCITCEEKSDVSPDSYILKSNRLSKSDFHMYEHEICSP
jgi:hypothetical protein